MASDYEAIRKNNIKRYGTDIGRIGPMLLANRYDERTHFIFELLQNAEDALSRLQQPVKSSSVSFHLQRDALRVSHFGDPFTELDVQGICGIDESTKNANEIGRFGMGFKSVYAFCDRPEIHSSEEDFAIENFVLPIAVPKIKRATGETVILIPFKNSLATAYDEINSAFFRLGASTLLFLRYINKFSWVTEHGSSGQYCRQTCDIDSNVRRVTIVGKQYAEDVIDEEWLIFSHPVNAPDGTEARPIEIAFSYVNDPNSQNRHIQRINRSPLVVFFPTAVETYLGFLLQGPYRTTPSRDNIPRDDDWNRDLVSLTAELLRESLCWLRDHHQLNTEVLSCLPLNSEKFDDDSIFAPLFKHTKDMLSTESLLPREDNGFIAAPNALLGRSQDLRNLFNTAQLTALNGDKGELAWLTGRITQIRTRELWVYLTKELKIKTITSEFIVRRLTSRFLEAQPDTWIQQLYEFLNKNNAVVLRLLLSEIPILRLEDRTHVTFEEGEYASAYLSTKATTGFPIVRTSVCTTKESRQFLIKLGLREPGLVDDVITNILPKYQSESTEAINDAEYESDISRILKAYYDTNLFEQRNKLVENLIKSRFVKAVHAFDNSKHCLIPRDVYLATNRLVNLLDRVQEIFFVDISHACLKGNKIRNLLKCCGTTDHLQSVSIPTSFTPKEKRAMRIEAGCEDISYHGSVSDKTLRGIDGLLGLLPDLDGKEQATRARLLWEALDELESRPGKTAFSGIYRWYYVKERETQFDAHFVQQLNNVQWVPNGGNLHCPKFVSFDSLGWKKNPFLESIIHFKAREMDALVQNLGIEPGVIDLLCEAGISTEHDLRIRLGLDESVLKTTEPTRLGKSNDTKTGSEAGHAEAEDGNSDLVAASRPKGANAREFVSYIAVHSEKDVSAQGGHIQEERIELEKKAIEFILKSEPRWQLAPRNNPGYDLFRTNEEGLKIYCEVKAMTKTLDDHPVGMSHTQFEHAYKHRKSFWLYIVEHAGNSENTCIVRIQDPAGNARTFTYDSGWRNIATM